MLKQTLSSSYQYLQASKLIELKAQSMTLTTNSAGKFCWKLFDSCLWPEKTPVQEKLPLTLNVPGTVGGEGQHESMDVGTQILLERLLHWKGPVEEMTCPFRVVNEQHLNPTTQGSSIKWLHSSSVWDFRKKRDAHVISSSFLNKENVIWLHDGFKCYFLAEKCFQICLTRLFTLGWFFPWHLFF